VRFKPTDITYQLVDIDDLRPHPQNPNNGDLETLEKSVRKHGVFRSLVVSQDMVILAGNHTCAAAIKAGETQVWAGILPIKHDSEQAIKVMLIDNQSRKKAKDDVGLLVKLMEGMPSLEGTGFDRKELDELIEKCNSDFSPLDDRDVCEMCGARLKR
jgi:ParB-like chromosome segregation protein Spo0J